MELLILPGNAEHNRDYAYAMREVFTPLFNETFVHEYAHWDDGQPLVDIDRELALLREEYLNRNDDEIIFAKSVGIIVALRAIEDGVLHPKKCMFVGMPLRYIKEQELNMTSLLTSVSVPLLFLQNEHDPEGSYSEVKGLLAYASAQHPFVLAKLQGQTHDYDQTEMLFNTMTAFARQ